MVHLAPMLYPCLHARLKSRMPLGEMASKVMRWLLLNASSAMNLSSGVVTAGTSDHALRHARSVVMCAGYSHSNRKPYVLQKTRQSLQGSTSPAR